MFTYFIIRPGKTFFEPELTAGLFLGVTARPTPVLRQLNR
jgi:hypothetical protein